MDGEEILEKIENINMRINALKNVIIKYTNGELSESDSLEQLLDDELFQESYSDRKDVVQRIRCTSSMQIKCA